MQIGTTDAIAQVQQHFGDAAHPGPADPDEMDMLDTMFHDAFFTRTAHTMDRDGFAGVGDVAGRIRHGAGARAGGDGLQLVAPRAGVNQSASHCGVNSVCWRSQAAPASLKYRALAVW